MISLPVLSVLDILLKHVLRKLLPLMTYLILLNEFLDFLNSNTVAVLGI